MKIKTSELTDAALDWAVAACESNKPYVVGAEVYAPNIYGDYELFNPSAEWAQGGPIIEREAIAVSMGEDGDAWCAWFPLRQGIEDSIGATPLEAAMRCYVASKLGEEVDIPKLAIDRLMKRKGRKS